MIRNCFIGDVMCFVIQLVAVVVAVSVALVDDELITHKHKHIQTYTRIMLD